MRHFPFALLAVCLAATAPAAAQDAGEAAAAWGLLGTWATNCSSAPGPSSARLSFVRSGDKLLHRRDFGKQRDEFTVPSASVLPDGSLEVVIDLAPMGERRTIVFARAGEGRKRAIANRGEKGDYTIRDGKFAASGAPTPVQTRCSALTN